MAVLTFDSPAAKIYEAGLDHAVVYPDSGAPFVWNGLVDAKYKSAMVGYEPVFIDGILIALNPSYDEAALQLTALTYPKDMERFFGTRVSDGVSFLSQDFPSFGLSFRTGLANELTSELGVLYHIFYKCQIIADSFSFKTLENDTSLDAFSWDVKLIPVAMENHRPAPTLRLDSRYMSSGDITYVENKLWGSPSTAPVLPSYSALYSEVGI